MTYQVATDSPARYQFESSAGSLYSSQVYNCGLASIAKITQYYRDTWVGIEASRRLIYGKGPYIVNGSFYYGCPPSTPTTAWQQRDMLRARGVACEVYQIPTVDALANLVSTGKRPVLLGLNFARVPDSVAGHNFQGWHAVVVLSTTYVNGQMGFFVMDPNFSPPGGPRPDPMRGKRFYSRSSMVWALGDAATNWAVVPLTPKNVAPVFSEVQEMAIMANIQSVEGRYFDVKAGVTLRKGPGTKYPKHFVTPSQEQYWLHGFVYGKDGWVCASRTKTSTGFFFVPPNH